MHLHGDLKEILLDYGPAHVFWLFSFEHYNGILGKQPINNRAIESQLMNRFLKDAESSSFCFPEELKEDFSAVMVPERLDLGSLRETFTLSEFALPKKYTGDVFDSDKTALIQDLLGQLNHVDSKEIAVNSI